MACNIYEPYVEYYDFDKIAVQCEPPLIHEINLDTLTEDSVIQYIASRERQARLLIRSSNLGSPVVQATVRFPDGSKKIQRGMLIGCIKSGENNELLDGVLRRGYIPQLQDVSGGIVQLPRVMTGPDIVSNRKTNRFKR